MAQTILIIDDDIDTLKLVGIMLERKGFRILASTTGEKGLQLVNKEYPDLVLLDVMIPDINGYEIARSIRTNPATENTPIIMFTARSQVDDKVEGLEAGADAWPGSWSGRIYHQTCPSQRIIRPGQLRPETRSTTLLSSYSYSCRKRHFDRNYFRQRWDWQLYPCDKSGNRNSQSIRRGDYSY